MHWTVASQSESADLGGAGFRRFLLAGGNRTPTITRAVLADNSRMDGIGQIAH